MLGSGAKVRVRGGKVADAKALARVFKDSWMQAYQGLLPHAHLENLVKERNADWWRRTLRAGDGVMVLEMGGVIAGYATLGPARRRGKYKGEIYELYLDPIYQGLGMGEHLFEGCRHNLDERGLDGLVVWALIDNTRACDFYWRRGGRPFTSTMSRVGSARKEKVAFGWK